MKLIKMLGLAAITAVAAISLVNTSSAMAEPPTLLCKNNTESLTPTAEQCDPATSIHFETVSQTNPLEAGKAKLLTSSFTIECNVLLHGEILKLGSPQSIKATITYSNCTGGCTITTLENGTILVLKLHNWATEGHDELTSVTAHNFKVRVVCIGVINCTYTPEGLTGHGHRGHGLPHITYNEAPVKGTGLTCPESKLDALFRSLTDFFIRS